MLRYDQMVNSSHARTVLMTNRYNGVTGGSTLRNDQEDRDSWAHQEVVDDELAQHGSGVAKKPLISFMTIARWRARRGAIERGDQHCADGFT
jgi:hypothetical protein